MRKCAAHPMNCTGYCATQINGVVHSKYTEEKSVDSFCEPDSGECFCSRSLAA